jgi:adenylate cyclase
MVRESSRIPPEYIMEPVKLIMEAEPATGLINDLKDIDGFSREYSIAGFMDHEPGIPYPTLGLKCVQEYFDISDTVKLVWNNEELVWTFGPLNIQAHGKTNSFLVNYYGPPSGYKLPGTNYPTWGTFPSYSLSQVLDTQDFELSEDLDWMSQFIPGEIPEWIMAIEDEDERKGMMTVMGIGDGFDISESPFYNKIVILGVSVEVLHDVKSTPFYNYLGETQDTPGFETHANAIQTIIHDNYLNVFGGSLTRLFHGGTYPFVHFLVVAVLCIIAYFLFRKLDMYPILAGIIILMEGIIYYGLALGLFANDIWWMVKSSIAAILPYSIHDMFYESLLVKLPDSGKSHVMPIVAPLAGVVITYVSNVIYQFLNEQKDKKFLKDTFSTYISPGLIDKMHEEHQAPKLGGVQDYHTAFFSDIQNFSTFSEVLDPERLVRLMNEYLTAMTNVLLVHEGTLDKYIGDAIVAFYGAPAPVIDHEKKACATALAMRIRLKNLREKWKKEGDWPEIVYSMRHRIGLNCGSMVTGNMGSDMRMQYTMMGDTVNLAARLEPAAKKYGVYIFVGENIYDATNNEYVFRFLDFLQVKGKKIPVRVYELMDTKDSIERPVLDLIETFEDGLDHYFKQEWDKALNLFEKSESMELHFEGRNTTPSAVFMDRCKHFIEQPPEKNWDGVWRMVTK